MELKLQQLMRNAEGIAALRNMDDTNPIKLPVTHPNLGTVTVLVLSIAEPTTMVLPLNVTWFNFNPLSPHYRKALRRVSKEPSSLYGHTWEVVDTYSEVFVDQYYDSGDQLILIGEEAGVSMASDTVQGIVRLSLPAAQVTDPVACGDNDPRLSDPRVPLPHTHPQGPATALRTNSNTVVIDTSEPPQAGMVLVATGPTGAVWRFLNENDIQQV
jgi:hypothetical protein